MGHVLPADPGEQVKIVFLENDPGSPVIVGRVFDLNHLPLAVPSGELWLVHASGAFLKLTNDGKLSLNSSVEIPVGDLTETVRTLCNELLWEWAKTHRHANVQNGSGTSGPPSTLPDGTMLTSVLKAN